MQRERKNGNPLKLPPRCHFKHNAFWYIHASSGKWENLGSDIHQARFRAEHYNHANDDAPLMESHIHAYLVHFEQLVRLQRKAPRTLADYLQYAQPLIAYFGKMTAESITPEHIIAYLLHHQQLGRGVRANREKAFLSCLFNWLIATKRSNTIANPCSKIPKNQEIPRRRQLSTQEYQTVFQLATPQVQLAMALTYITLQNPNAIVTLKRDAVQHTDDGTYLHIQHPKTGKVLTIPLDSSIVELIQPPPITTKPATRPAQNYLLLSRLGTRYTTSGIAAMLHRYQKISQIPPFGLLDIKVKGALDLAQAGTALETIADLLGHGAVTITRRFLEAHTAST